MNVECLPQTMNLGYFSLFQRFEGRFIDRWYDHRMQVPSGGEGGVG